MPPDNPIPQPSWSDNDSGVFSSADLDAANENDDPSLRWRETHQAIRDTIAELGGKVVPKLNWSAPKDATWISTTNSMECREPNDIYLLLKSSDFITHDLEHAFDDCVDEKETSNSTDQSQQNLSTDAGAESTNIPYHLVLRKFVLVNPSVEFRCFVRERKLIAICQRDSNHYAFLFDLKDMLRDVIVEFFRSHLQNSFPDDNFTFDVYIPAPHQRVWLIDVNPWAPRTDALLFSWYELLDPDDFNEDDAGSEDMTPPSASENEEDDKSNCNVQTQEKVIVPEFRLIRKNDPEAYQFNTAKYSAHKLPRDVVDASNAGVGGLAEFAKEWQSRISEWEEQRLAGNTSMIANHSGTDASEQVTG